MSIEHSAFLLLVGLKLPDLPDVSSLDSLYLFLPQYPVRWNSPANVRQGPELVADISGAADRRLPLFDS